MTHTFKATTTINILVLSMFMALAAGLAGAVASIAGSRSYLLAFGIAAVTVSLVVIKKGLYADRNKAPSIEGIEVAVDREIEELFKTPDRK
jgi:membrane protein implicated in regulation of membrane protease activity